jgi:protein SCO1
MFQTAFLKISFSAGLFLTACSSGVETSRLPYYNKPDFTPEFIESTADVEKKIRHVITSFSMMNQHGKQISEKEVDGKVHVANFIFTSCGSICPVMTKHMKLVNDKFKGSPDVVLLSFSVTPWIDSVRKLKAYAEHNNITSPNWHLLTGDKGEIYALARKSYFAEEDIGFTRDSSEFLHTEHFLLVDKTRRIRGIYNGTLQLEAEQMMKDIEVLLKE